MLGDILLALLLSGAIYVGMIIICRLCGYYFGRGFWAAKKELDERG